MHAFKDGMTLYIRGKPVDEMTREELLDVVKMMWSHIEVQHKLATSAREFLELAREARR